MIDNSAPWERALARVHQLGLHPTNEELDELVSLLHFPNGAVTYAAAEALLAGDDSCWIRLIQEYLVIDDQVLSENLAAAFLPRLPIDAPERLGRLAVWGPEEIRADCIGLLHSFGVAHGAEPKKPPIGWAENDAE